MVEHFLKKSVAPPKDEIQAVCRTCDDITRSLLVRVDYGVVNGVEVHDTLVYKCVKCSSITCPPNISSGRIRAYKPALPEALEVHLTHDTVDLPLG